MDAKNARVAVLLATYEGARFVDAQIHSLQQNATPFTLHWIDDHSSDSTPEVVRASAREAGIKLCEWHHPLHLGVPHAFFRLVECVDADIYLFCDQDDIWQPGKIDSAVANLSPQLASPVLCSSEFFIFQEADVSTRRALGDLVGEKILQKGTRPSRMFTPAAVAGHSQAFTRPLRQIFLSHKEIAYEYAFMHDLWMYNLAVACGAARMFRDVPTTLYRRHQNSFCQKHLAGVSLNWIARNWRFQQLWRRSMSRHARGLLLALPTLPEGLEREQAIELAGRFAAIDQRQSFAAMMRLAANGALWASLSQAAWFSLACLYSKARRSQQPLPHGSVVAADL